MQVGEEGEGEVSSQDRDLATVCGELLALPRLLATTCSWTLARSYLHISTHIYTYLQLSTVIYTSTGRWIVAPVRRTASCLATTARLLRAMLW